MNRYIHVIHPSRSRPEMAFETYQKWRKRGQTGFDYTLSIDIDDPLKDRYLSLFKEANVIINNNKSAIEAINVAADFVVSKTLIYDDNKNPISRQLLVVISDDFDCPNDWDLQLLEALNGKSDFIVKTQDGIQKTLITLPIMDEFYYNRFGYVYENSYIHMSSDVEMTMVGYMLDKIITLPIIFKHNHYTVGGMKKDSTNEKNDMSYSHGHQNLNRRKKFNFGLKDHEIVKNYNNIIWH